MHLQALVSVLSFSLSPAPGEAPPRLQLMFRVKETRLEQHHNTSFGEVTLFSEGCHSLYYHCKRRHRLLGETPLKAVQSQKHLSPSLAWDSNYSTRLLDFLRNFNAVTSIPKSSQSRVLLHASKNFFLRLEFPNQSQVCAPFPKPVPLCVTVHANISEREQPDGIKVLWGSLRAVEKSPVAFLTQSLLKESLKRATFCASLAEQKEASERKQRRLEADLEVLVADKRRMKKRLLQKALLVINEKKAKVRELSRVVETKKAENERLKTELQQKRAKSRPKKRLKKVKKE